MINLMPPDDRRQLAAARTNTLLLRYAILIIPVIAFLCLEMTAMYVVISTSKSHDEETIRENEQKTVAYADVKKQAESFRSNLSTARYILDKQIPYTTLMLALANNLPQGAVLDKLSIDPTTFGTPTTLTIKTDTYDKSIQIKTTLQNIKINNVSLFSTVSFQSVTTQSTSQSQTYPVTAIYNVIYSKGVLAR